MLFDILKIYFLSSSSLAQKKPPVKDGIFFIPNLC